MMALLVNRLIVHPISIRPNTICHSRIMIKTFDIVRVVFKEIGGTVRVDVAVLQSDMMAVFHTLLPML